MQNKKFNERVNNVLYGGDYNPEQWPGNPDPDLPTTTDLDDDLSDQPPVDMDS